MNVHRFDRQRRDGDFEHPHMAVLEHHMMKIRRSSDSVERIARGITEYRVRGKALGRGWGAKSAARKRSARDFMDALPHPVNARPRACKSDQGASIV